MELSHLLNCDTIVEQGHATWKEKENRQVVFFIGSTEGNSFGHYE